MSHTPRYYDRNLPAIERFAYHYAIRRIHLQELIDSGLGPKSHGFMRAEAVVDDLRSLPGDVFDLATDYLHFKVVTETILAEQILPLYGPATPRRSRQFHEYADAILRAFGLEPVFDTAKHYPLPNTTAKE